MPRTFNVLALAAALAVPALAGGDKCWIEKDANVCVDDGYYQHGSGYYKQNCGVKFDPKEGSWPMNGDEGEDCPTFEKCLDMCEEKGAGYAVHDGAKCKVYAEGKVAPGGSYTVGKHWGPKNPCEEEKTTTTTTGWSPMTTGWKEKEGCEPWTEEYVCDDDKDGEYTTTMTKYSKGCPGYTEMPEWTKPAKTTNAWNSWPTDDPKGPKGPKGPKDGDKDDEEEYDDDEHKGKGPKGPKGPKDDDEESWSTWVDPKPAKSTDAWNTWVDPKPVKSTDAWNTWVDPKPTETWKAWPKTTDPAMWEDVEYVDGKKIVVVTFIEEYEVPCSTGWEKKTTTVYGTHCGCTETPKPAHPEYTTYVTECPESWGIGKTVTVKVPYATWTPKKVDAETTTWATWVEPTVTKSASWSAWTGVDAAKCSLTTSTWTTTECGGSSSTWADCKPVTKTATITPASCYPDNGVSWGVWSTSTKPAADATTWASWSTSTKPADATWSSWSPVATWKGAATNTAVNKVMVVLAGAVAGFAFIL